MIDRVFPRCAVSSTLLALGLAACGPGLPPKDLVQARTAYDRASKGPAAELAPAELDTAKQSLMRAEATFQDEGDAPVTRDRAYVAERKAMSAEAQAGIVQAERERAAVEKDFKKAQIESLDNTKAALQAERSASEKSRAEIANTKAQLEAEKKAREEAEKRAAAALASLNEIAKVKEESRGVVITLSGAVLFATGKYELLPIAREKLNEVAKALKDQGFKSILVEGHTDSRGNASANEELSFKRADSVRTHLVSQGIPADKIRATGLGSSRPVADNNSTEGRANNRRVEIVVEPDR
jgi:outer membrane protein OmpA-like peptidoglycan-associated protein